MVRIALAALALALAAGAGSAHDGIENRTGLRSAPVIASNMRELGLEPGAVTLDGAEARVAVTAQGRPAVLSIDRVTGAARMLSGDAAAVAPLKARLGRSWLGAAPLDRPAVALDPGAAARVPTLRPQLSPQGAQPAPRALRIQPQN